jgi:hypothetical protein
MSLDELVESKILKKLGTEEDLSEKMVMNAIPDGFLTTEGIRARCLRVPEKA